MNDVWDYAYGKSKKLNPDDYSLMENKNSSYDPYTFNEDEAMPPEDFLTRKSDKFTMQERPGEFDPSTAESAEARALEMEDADSADGDSMSSGGMKALGKGLDYATYRKAKGFETDDAVSGALMSSGNPYAMAAGAAIRVVDAQRKKKQEYLGRQQERVEKIQSQQTEAYNNLAAGMKGIGGGLR